MKRFFKAYVVRIVSDEEERHEHECGENVLLLPSRLWHGTEALKAVLDERNNNGSLV
jgi:hypothetical protein